MGDELKCKRAIVFEDLKNGRYGGMAGSKFSVFGFETNETYFRDDVARFEKNVSEAGIKVSVGALYCLNGAMDMMSVIKSANQKMRNGGQHA